MKLRPSSLGQFMACPFKYKYTEFDGNPRDLYFGTILHAAANGQDVDFLFEYYIKQLNPNLKVKHKYKDLLDLAYKEYEENKEKIILSETELLAIENIDGYEVDFSGTPDRIVNNNKGNIFLDDFKTSNSFSWYDGGQCWEISAQPFLYTYIFMKIYDLDEIIFRFIVFSKSNGEKRIYNRKYSFNEVKEKKDNLIKDYLQTINSGKWDARKNPLCNFCPLKDGLCPLYNENKDEIF